MAKDQLLSSLAGHISSQQIFLCDPWHTRPFEKQTVCFRLVHYFDPQRDPVNL